MSNSFLDIVPETVRFGVDPIDLEADAAIRFETTEIVFWLPGAFFLYKVPVMYGINSHKSKTNNADNKTYQPHAEAADTAMSQRPGPP